MIELMARIGPESALVAHCLEQASWHQTRALAYTREARGARAAGWPPGEERTLHLQALEHLVQAQRLVQQAQQASRSPAQAMVLGEHLARLQAIAEDVEGEASACYLAVSPADYQPFVSE